MPANPFRQGEDRGSQAGNGSWQGNRGNGTRGQGHPVTSAPTQPCAGPAGTGINTDCRDEWGSAHPGTDPFIISCESLGVCRQPLVQLPPQDPVGQMHPVPHLHLASADIPEPPSAGRIPAPADCLRTPPARCPGRAWARASSRNSVIRAPDTPLPCQDRPRTGAPTAGAARHALDRTGLGAQGRVASPARGALGDPGAPADEGGRRLGAKALRTGGPGPAPGTGSRTTR